MKIGIDISTILNNRKDISAGLYIINLLKNLLLIPPTKNRNIFLTIHDLAFIRFPHFNFEWFVKKYIKKVKKNE